MAISHGPRRAISRVGRSATRAISGDLASRGRAAPSFFELAFDVMKQTQGGLTHSLDRHPAALGPTDIPPTRRPRARPAPAGREGSGSLGCGGRAAAARVERADEERRPRSTPGRGPPRGRASGVPATTAAVLELLQ